MAISPWHVASHLKCFEVAGLLSGLDISAVQTGVLISDEDIFEQTEWFRVIVDAAKKGELKPVAVQVLEKHGEPDHVEKAMIVKSFWKDRNPDAIGWTFYAASDVRLTLERRNVYRWLKASGIADDDIPEALRVMPTQQQQQSEELHPKREATYQRIIATLLAVQYSASELEEPYRLADQVLDDCQAQNVKAPASRNTLGELFKQLPRVQKAPLD